MITDPTDILKTYLNEQVCAGTKNGEYFRGKLLGFDEHHNILLAEKETTKFIRGEILVFIGQEN